MALLPRGSEHARPNAWAKSPTRRAHCGPPRHAILPTLHVRFILHGCALRTQLRTLRRPFIVRPTYDAHEFFNFATLVGFVARVDRMFDTVRHVDLGETSPSSERVGNAVGRLRRRRQSLLQITWRTVSNMRSTRATKPTSVAKLKNS